MFEKDTYLGFDNVLIKADKKDPTIIYLEASNEGLDSDDELVIMKALEDETENYLKKGLISWDHLHKTEKNPKYIIGEPLDVKYSEDNRTLIKGRLYKSKEYAQEVMKLVADKTTRLGASIGGAIVSKSKSFSKEAGKVIPVINKIKWDEVAITHKPVNVDTLGKCSFFPFSEFAKSFRFEPAGFEKSKEILAMFNKALSVGSGVDAAAFTGGRSLIPESLGKQLSTKGFWVDLLKNIMNGRIINYNSLRTYLGGMSNSDVKGIATIVVANKHKILEKL